MSKAEASKMKTGLFFGSFNPIHQGHLDIANYMAEFTDLDEIWFIVSPHNPLKERDTLLSDFHRLEMVRIAVEENNKIKSPIKLQHADIEFDLPQPSYTINTLKHIKEKFPEKEFALIVGSDNLSQFDKWKDYKMILENYELYVYPRPQSDGGELSNHHNVKLINAPLIDISSDDIRKLLGEGKDVRDMLPGSVLRYIKEQHLY